jgi:3-oxoacyl-[acyl-carrier-protein] synthase-3
MGIKIVGLGSYLPQYEMTNAEWSNHFETSDEWIFSHTGIKCRHIAAEGESTADLAVACAQVAMAQAGITAQDLDLIVVATVSPDYLGFPSTANLVQQRLNCRTIASYDVRAACSGFVYGLTSAQGMMLASRDMKRALVIGVEVLSSIINWKDRSTAILFGDGAGAVILEKDDTETGDILDSVLYSCGDVEALSRPKGGVADPKFSDSAEAALHMDGARVYQFGVRVLGELVEELCTRNHLTMDDVDWVVPHQANGRMIDALIARKGWSKDKFFMNVEHTANTSAASIPIALAEMQSKGLLKVGQKVLLAGFGAGLTWGGVYLKWSL